LNPTTAPAVGVGEFTTFQVLITNTGDGIARRVIVESKFDAGLKHLQDTLNTQHVTYGQVGDLAPGKSATVPLTFEVVAPGTHCQTVTISAEGAQPVSQRGCVTANAADLRLTVNGPRSRVAGEQAPFDIVVKNGDTPARNVEVVVRFDPALEPETIRDPSHERLPDGSILLKFGDLARGEQRPISIDFRCKTASNNACARANLTAEGGFTTAAEDCVEILPPSPAEPGILAP
jgi:hypothetical protein